MAFRKTSVAINTRVIPEDGPKAFSTSMPNDPELGQHWDSFVWDGGKWILLTEWNARLEEQEN